jgi:hypothetical protein
MWLPSSGERARVMVRTWSSFGGVCSPFDGGDVGPATFASMMGDFDFGIPACATGHSVGLARGAVGRCAHSGHEQLLRPQRASRVLWSTNELAPRPWAIHTRRWAVPLPPVYRISLFAERGLHAVVARLRHRTQPQGPRRPR